MVDSIFRSFRWLYTKNVRHHVLIRLISPSAQFMPHNTKTGKTATKRSIRSNMTSKNLILLSKDVRILDAHSRNFPTITRSVSIFPLCSNLITEPNALYFGFGSLVQTLVMLSWILWKKIAHWWDQAFVQTLFSHPTHSCHQFFSSLTEPRNVVLNIIRPGTPQRACVDQEMCKPFRTTDVSLLSP